METQLWIGDRMWQPAVRCPVEAFLGPEAGPALLEELPGVEGIVVDSDGKISASKGLAGVGERSPNEKPDRLDSHQKHNE